MADTQKSLYEFFKEFEDPSVESIFLQKKWCLASPEGEVRMSAKNLNPEMLSVETWQSYKKYCAEPKSLLPENEVMMLLGKREAILAVIQKQEKTASVEKTSESTSAGRSGGEQSIKTAQPSPLSGGSSEPQQKDAPLPVKEAVQPKLLENRDRSQVSAGAASKEQGQIPADFEDLFGRKTEPVTGARLAMLSILNDPAISTADLYTTLDWCKEQRPHDLFETYAVTMLAEPLPEPEKEPLVERDLYEQTAWTRDNFSEERYRALIALRHRLRKAGLLPVSERAQPSHATQGGENNSGPFVGKKGGGSSSAREDCAVKKVLQVGGMILLILGGSVVAYLYTHSAPQAGVQPASSGKQ
ncbi:hypothetical protein NQF86_05500 [Bombella sp. TMW 2.2543]|uniref:Uncharacterized protein n=1 Tax=Bombella pluederhausensis TaxID=2967336 RepID=A0ABT3WG87_9PROT|nr:hypothetical protein [Bombella pluederhausensis]MCX5618117.1 hypothetical protein [Bombella pluederhausensis]